MSASGPKARALLTTSESRDPSSPHYDDQTLVFPTKQLRAVLFEEADIAAAPGITTTMLSAPR
jgi:acyl-homoserine-lactone acylase